MIALIYSLACGICWWLAWREAAFIPKPYHKFRLVYPFLWVILGAILGLLALQEKTGLLGFITDAARQNAVHGGWYGQRRPFQWLLVKVTPLLAAGLGGLILWVIRRSWTRYLLAVIAIFYWLSFTGIQGISYHNIDWMLRQRFGGLLLKTWGDLTGLLLTAAAILAAWKDDQRSGTEAFSKDIKRLFNAEEGHGRNAALAALGAEPDALHRQERSIAGTKSGKRGADNPKLVYAPSLSSHTDAHPIAPDKIEGQKN